MLTSIANAFRNFTQPRRVEPSGSAPSVADQPYTPPPRTIRRPLVTAADLSAVCPQGRYLGQVATALNDSGPKWGVDTAKRMAALVAQCAHESAGFTAFAEDLHYRTVRQLRAVWPSRFESLSDTDAQAYTRNPQRLANLVYSGRMGNGAPESDDGWRFRGRGLIQLTGRDNYSRLARSLGRPMDDGFLRWVEQPEGAVTSALWFWSDARLGDLLERGGIDAVSKRVNGGRHGMLERRSLFERLVHILSQEMSA
jgi:putative chitinase